MEEVEAEVVQQIKFSASSVAFLQHKTVEIPEYRSTHLIDSVDWRSEQSNVHFREKQNTAEYKGKK
jgi:hypothetical protein